MKEYIGHYDSIGDFARRAESIAARRVHFYGGLGNTWYTESNDSWSGEGFTAAMRHSIQGDEALVPLAESLLHSLELPIDTRGMVWSSAPYGAYPIIPEYLAGFPEPMRAPRNDTSDRQPISVYLSSFVSAGVSSTDLLKRGSIILALLMHLQTQRAIDLYLLVGAARPNRLVTIKLDSRPICLAQAAYVLSVPSFFRRLGMPVLLSDSESDDSVPRPDEDWTREALNLTPSDLYLGPTVYRDPMLDDPKGWLSSQLACYEGEID